MLATFVIGGFIAVGSAPVHAAMSQGDGMMLYGESTVTTPRYNIFNNSQFGAEATGATAAATIRHTVIKAAPTGGGRNEMIAGIQTTGGQLYIQRWDGTSWTNEWNVTVGDSNLPRFDIAYEQTSGRAVVVYSGNIIALNELQYRTFNGTSWTGATNLDTTRTGGTVDAIQLEPRSGSNDIGLAWADNLWDLSANFWDATANSGAGGWVGEPAAALSANLSRVGAPAGCITTATCMTTWSFDLAFESTSGELVVGWGTEAASDPTFQKRTAGAGGAWSGTNVAGTAAVEEATDMEMTSDPNSNFIGYANITGESTASAASPDLEGGMWDGGTDTYGNSNSGDTASGAVESSTNNVTTGWVRSGTTDVFVVVYDDAAAAVNFRYFTKNTLTWAAGTDFTGVTAPAAAQKLLRLRSNPFDASELMLVMVDSASDVFTKKLVYGGGTTFTWTSVGPSNGTAAHELTASSITGMSADYAYNKFIPPVTYDQSAYRWFGNTTEPSAFDGDGVIDGAAASNAATTTGTTTDATSLYVVGSDDSTNWRIEKRDKTTGALDTNFDGDGIIDGAAASTAANAIAIDATYMYVAGYDSSTNFRIEKRLLTTGALDTNFDGDGIIDGAAASNIASAIAIDATYMYIAGLDDSTNFRIEKRLLTTGALCDAACGTAFDTDGVVDGAAASNAANAIAIDATYMYVAGINSSTNFRIEKRLLTTGALCDAAACGTAFDTDGVVDGASGSESSRAIAIDATSLYVAGYNSSFNFRIEKRLLTTGALDTNFDGDGVVDGAAASNVAYATTNDATSMYIAGSDDGNNWRIEKRALGNGVLISGPDVSSPLAALNTTATAPVQGTPFRLRMNVHVDGNNLPISGQSLKLQFAGKGAGTCAAPSGTPSSYTDVTTSTAIKYYNNSLVSDGDSFVANSNDPTHSSDNLKRQTYEELNNFTNSVSAINLGEDGMWDFALTDYTAPEGTAYCFKVVKSDGNALNTYSQYAEIATAAINYEQSAYRWFNNQDGPSAFDGDGVVDGAAASKTPRKVVADSTYMYIAGSDDSNNFRIEKRLLTTGALCDAAACGTAFDTDGVVDGAAASTEAQAINIDSTYMYVVGYNDSNNWRIEKRLLTTGALCDAAACGTAFDTDGVVDGAAASNGAQAITIDSTYMYVVGYNDSNNWRIEKRLLTTGALCDAAACGTAFDTDGVVDGAAASFVAEAIAIDSTYMYVAGYVDGADWRIEKRLLTTGALCDAAACGTAFDTDGVVDGAAASNGSYDIAIDSTYMYIAGDDSSSNFRIEKRLLTTGALDNSFDGDGVVDGATASQIPNVIAIDSTYMYVAGYNSSTDFRIEKRLLTTGALDTDFDGDGVLDGATESATIQTIVLDASSLYAVGSDSSNNYRIEKRLLATATLIIGTNVSTPLAALNTTATAPVQGTPFRLRMNLHISGNNLAQSGQSFKLQFAGKGAGTCAAPSGTPASYTDVTTGTAIKYYDNSTPTDDSSFTSNANDPTHSTDTLKRQTYEEANNFTNSVSTISPGQDGMWDFALTDNTAPAATSYCFRAVKSDNSALNTYTQYAGITTNAGGNAAPGTPTSLAQKKTDDTVVVTGGWTNESSIKLTASVSDSDGGDTIKICAEVKAITVALTSPAGDGDGCSTTGVSSGGTAIVTIAGLSPNTEYHWQIKAKDAAGAFSAWAGYGGNTENPPTNPAARDFGVDTSAPSVATVFDNTNTVSQPSASDSADNGDGSLTTLSATWNAFDATVSGLQKYEYSIGTTSGGTDIKTWTDNTTGTTIRTGSLTLQTGKTYFVNVRATDNAGNVSSVASSNGQIVAPTITFDIDISATDSETSPPYAVNFGGLSGGTVSDSPVKVWIDFTTNGAGGGRVYITGQQAGLRSTLSNFTISAVTGDLTSLSTGFGAQGSTATQSSGGPLSISTLYNVAGNNVGTTDTTIRDIFSSPAPITGGRGSFLLKAKPSVTTPASTDYSETLTLIAAPSY